METVISWKKRYHGKSEIMEKVISWKKQYHENLKSDLKYIDLWRFKLKNN